MTGVIKILSVRVEEQHNQKQLAFWKLLTVMYVHQSIFPAMVVEMLRYLVVLPIWLHL